MGLSLHKKFLVAAFFLFSLQSFANTGNQGDPVKALSGGPEKKDSMSVRPVISTSLCSCQVLDLESTNHRHRNFALFAEKRYGRSMSADLNRINRIIEKEKKHMQVFFYDKLTVVHAFTEATDCRSLYSKLKSGNKSLVMYDILNADTRR